MDKARTQTAPYFNYSQAALPGMATSFVKKSENLKKN